MSSLIIICASALLFIIPQADAADKPKYLQQFASQYLTEFISPVTNNAEMRISSSNENWNLSLKIKTPAGDVFSQYTFSFVEAMPGHSLVNSIPVLSRERMMDAKQYYLEPAIKGTVEIPVDSGSLLTNFDYRSVIRRMFRADPMLHPLLESPVGEKKEFKLTPPQMEVLNGIKGQRDGLIQFYQKHNQSTKNKPMKAAVILPTGKGKTLVAIRYARFTKAMNNGENPFIIFVVQDTQILEDVWVKLRKTIDNQKISRLYGPRSQWVIREGTQAILATRSTYFKRLEEIHDFARQQPGPKLLYLDEAHHTGKAAGEFSEIERDYLEKFAPRDQVIHLTATFWHADDPALIRKVGGNVATSFVESHEYEQLIQGFNVERIARIQLLRAIAQGWLSPLSGLRFITQSSEGEHEGVIRFRDQFRLDTEKLTETLGLASIQDLQIEDLSDEQRDKVRLHVQAIHLPILKALAGDIVNQFIRGEGGNTVNYDRGLVYVPQIIHSEIYAVLLNQMLRKKNVQFRFVHSKMSVEKVRATLDWLSDLDGSKPFTHKYVINVGILREGVDIPAVNRIIFATNTELTKTLIQVLGRGTRLSSMKTGIRLTDLSGSFSRFFHDLPRDSIKLSFAAPSSPTDPRLNLVYLDGESISLESLVGLDIDDPEGKMKTMEAKDAEALKDALAIEVKAPLPLDEDLSWARGHELPNTLKSAHKIADAFLELKGWEPGDWIKENWPMLMQNLETYLFLNNRQDIWSVMGRLHKRSTKLTPILEKGYWRPYMFLAGNLPEDVNQFYEQEIRNHIHQEVLDEYKGNTQELERLDIWLKLQWLTSISQGRQWLASHPRVGDILLESGFSSKNRPPGILSLPRWLGTKKPEDGVNESIKKMRSSAIEALHTILSPDIEDKNLEWNQFFSEFVSQNYRGLKQKPRSPKSSESDMRTSLLRQLTAPSDILNALHWLRLQDIALKVMKNHPRQLDKLMTTGLLKHLKTINGQGVNRPLTFKSALEGVRKQMDWSPPSWVLENRNHLNSSIGEFGKLIGGTDSTTSITNVPLITRTNPGSGEPTEDPPWVDQYKALNDLDKQRVLDWIALYGFAYNPSRKGFSRLNDRDRTTLTKLFSDIFGIRSSQENGPTKTPLIPQWFVQNKDFLLQPISKWLVRTPGTNQYRFSESTDPNMDLHMSTFKVNILNEISPFTSLSPRLAPEPLVFELLVYAAAGLPEYGMLDKIGAKTNVFLKAMLGYIIEQLKVNPEQLRKDLGLIVRFHKHMFQPTMLGPSSIIKPTKSSHLDLTKQTDIDRHVKDMVNNKYAKIKYDRISFSFGSGETWNLIQNYVTQELLAKVENKISRQNTFPKALEAFERQIDWKPPQWLIENREVINLYLDMSGKVMLSPPPLMAPNMGPREDLQKQQKEYAWVEDYNNLSGTEKQKVLNWISFFNFTIRRSTYSGEERRDLFLSDAQDYLKEGHPEPLYKIMSDVSGGSVRSPLKVSEIGWLKKHKNFLLMSSHDLFYGEQLELLLDFGTAVSNLEQEGQRPGISPVGIQANWILDDIRKRKSIPTELIGINGAFKDFHIYELLPIAASGLTEFEFFRGVGRATNRELNLLVNYLLNKLGVTADELRRDLNMELEIKYKVPAAPGSANKIKVSNNLMGINQSKIIEASFLLGPQWGDIEMFLTREAINGKKTLPPPRGASMSCRQVFKIKGS